MFVAVGFRENEISSIFDISTTIEIVKIEDSITSVETIKIENGTILVELIHKLKEKDVTFLVCNIISKDAEVLFNMYGIRVLSSVTGNRETCFKFISEQRDLFFEKRNFRRRRGRGKGRMNHFIN